MKSPSISFLALCAGALAAPIDNRGVGSIKRISPQPPIVDGGLADAVKRTSPQPSSPYVDGGVDLGAIKVKRTSPVPPIVDGGLDLEAVKIKRTSPVPPIVDGGIEDVRD
ncbi:hypothetical protein EKO27_g3598 [Xylaria grammica]|uniref:Uncharacterized protein n=1 Tax=Xylaria grammica TaxID=363999 RepID=A0A439DAT4_9PEZI|nr:hypothetical protein EKO27_g3598 [Xylaria grammica]